MTTDLKNCGSCAHSERKFVPEREADALMCSGFISEMPEFAVQEHMGWHCKEWYHREFVVREPIYGEPPYQDNWTCPNCRCYEGITHKFIPNHCPYCGQKLKQEGK